MINLNPFRKKRPAPKKNKTRKGSRKGEFRSSETVSKRCLLISCLSALASMLRVHADLIVHQRQGRRKAWKGCQKGKAESCDRDQEASRGSNNCVWPAHTWNENEDSRHGCLFQEQGGICQAGPWRAHFVAASHVLACSHGIPFFYLASSSFRATKPEFKHQVMNLRSISSVSFLVDTESDWQCRRRRAAEGPGSLEIVITDTFIKPINFVYM